MAAIELELPNILYKYRKLPDKNTEAIFTDGEIYFATVDELNDPYEYFFSYPDSEQGPFYRTFSRMEQDIYPHTIVSDNPQLVRLDRDTELQYRLDGVKKNSNGIFSLCENKKSIAMYAHYAGGFRGVCIGFDWRSLDLNVVGSSEVFYQVPECEFEDAVVLYGQIKWCFFERGIRCKFINHSGCRDEAILTSDKIKFSIEATIETKILSEIKNSLYLNGVSCASPRKELPRKVNYESSPPIIDTPTGWLKVYSTKTVDFKWEEEWRLFFYPGKWKSPNVRHAIKEIIFGHRVSKGDRTKIMHLVNDINGIKFFIARPKIGKFELELEEVTLEQVQRNKEWAE